MSTNFEEVGDSQFSGPVGTGVLPFTTGKYIYVHNSGSGTSIGREINQPVVTSIDAAVGKCRASKGDVIVVLPGHVESITAAAGLALDTASITVYFMGEGESKATIDFSTVVGASMTVTANGVTFLGNPRFTASIDALTGPISVTASDFKIDHFDWYDSTDMNTTNCLVASSAADRIYIGGAKFYKSNESGTQKESFIKIGAVADPVIGYLDVVGDFSDAPVYNNVAWARVRMLGGILNNTNVGPSLAVKLSAASTGVAKNIHARVASGVLFVSAVNQMNWIDSDGVNADGEYQSIQIGDVSDYAHDPAIGANNADNAFDSTNVVSNPVGSLLERLQTIQEHVGATDSVTNIIGADDADNGFPSTNVVANADGSVIEREEYIQSSIGSGLGTAVAAIQTDLGNPSARTNLQSIEAMLGCPDTAGATIYAGLGGAAGLPTYPAAAPAGNDVSVAEVVRYIQETQLGTIANTGGTATLGGVLGDVLNVSVATRLINAQLDLDQLGTLVNTAGTAELGAMLGDFANVSLVTRLGVPAVSLAADIDAIAIDLGNPSARTNLQTLESMLGNPDAANKTIYGNIGDFVGDTNLQTLKAALGVPDVAAKPLYTCLVTDRLDHATYGLSALDTKIGVIDGFMDVPTQDAATDAQVRDVVGKKSDTTAGTSLVSLAKQIKAETDQVGTITNTGGTPTIGAVLGDVANIPIATTLVNAMNYLAVLDIARTGSGTEFVVKKSFASSQIVTGGVDITGVSSDGDLLIKDIHINTDGTGLVAGTNFEIRHNNVVGNPLIFSETVLNLGASATESLATGSVASVTGNILEVGKKLTAYSTGIDCTGAGTIVLDIVFQRVQPGATVAAA